MSGMMILLYYVWYDDTFKKYDCYIIFNYSGTYRHAQIDNPAERAMTHAWSPAFDFTEKTYKKTSKKKGLLIIITPSSKKNNNKNVF